MNGEYEEEELTPEEQAEFTADAAALGMTVEEYVGHWVHKLIEDLGIALKRGTTVEELHESERRSIREANEIVEPHLTGDD
jgi:hypothetical protein